MRFFNRVNFTRVHKDITGNIYKTDLETLYKKFKIHNVAYKFDINYSKITGIYCDDFLDTVVISEKIEPGFLRIKRGIHNLGYAKNLYDTTGKNLNLFIKIKEPDFRSYRDISSADYIEKTHY